jgi:hypothetical protein
VDDDDHPRKDPDDQIIRAYGRTATVVEVSAVVTLVKRYYTAVAAHDGAAACLLIYSGFTNGAAIAKALPSGYAPAPGSTVLDGKSCPQVASLLFGFDRQLLLEQHIVEGTPGPRVTAVRISGADGLAVLGFRTTPERWLPLKHEPGGWKIAAFLDSEIP